MFLIFIFVFGGIVIMLSLVGRELRVMFNEIFLLVGIVMFFMMFLYFVR